MTAPLGKERRRQDRAIGNPSVCSSDSLPLFLSRSAAALTLSIGLTSLDELVRAKRLKSIRLGRRVLISRASLLELLAECDTCNE